MATPAAIVAGAQRVSNASARLDAVGEALATRVSRRPHAGRTRAAPHAGRLGHADVARAAPVTPTARGLRRSRASSPRELSNGGNRR